MNEIVSSINVLTVRSNITVRKSVLTGQTTHTSLCFCTFIVTTIANGKISNGQVVDKSDLEMTAASTFIKVVCNSQI